MDIHADAGDRLAESPPRVPDPRPARTRAAILAAVERLSGLGPDQVTVSAIARDAGVSRSVFYTHFSGLEDLLSAVLAETADSATLVLDPRVPVPVRQLSTALVTRLVVHIESRATFYRAALGWRTTVAVHDAAVEDYARRLQELTAVVRASAADRAGLPPVEYTDFAATFVAGGISAALTAWLRTDRATPSATLVHDLLGLLPPWLLTDEIITTGTETPSCHV